MKKRYVMFDILIDDQLYLELQERYELYNNKVPSRKELTDWLTKTWLHNTITKELEGIAKL